jgi:hypothetical protein
MTRILEDGADALLRLHLAKFYDDCTKDWTHTMRAALSHGIAVVHVIDVDVVLASEPIHIYEQMWDAGELLLRIRLYLTERPDSLCVREDD